MRDLGLFIGLLVGLSIVASMILATFIAALSAYGEWVRWRDRRRRPEPRWLGDTFTVEEIVGAPDPLPIVELRESLASLPDGEPRAW